jgi:hypothetical protein
LSRAGDINADSVLDLLVGDATVQTDDTNALVQIGAVYIFSGYEMMAAWKAANDPNDTNLRHLRSSVNIGKITRIRSTTGVHYLGEQVAGSVDATGDGRVDILITARHVDFVLNGGPDYHAGVLLYSGLVFNQPVHSLLGASGLRPAPQCLAELRILGQGPLRTGVRNTPGH